MVSLADVRRQCGERRFDAYDNWRDRLFVPTSTLLVWFFVNLGWSGNAVSWLSGAVTILGGMLLATNDKALIVLGSFSYMLFYLLDYVDGGVSRYRKEESIGGLYTDWIMHAISAVSISMGIFIGALNMQGTWIVPFGILFILASALQLSRFSLGWWAICMHRQQKKSSNKAMPEDTSSLIGPEIPEKKGSYLLKVAGSVVRGIFYEKFIIFVLPVLAILNVFTSSIGFFDFRVVLTVLGGTIYFAFVTYKIVSLGNSRKLEDVYHKLFYSTDRPKLPAEYYIE